MKLCFTRLLHEYNYILIEPRNVCIKLEKRNNLIYYLKSELKECNALRRKAFYRKTRGTF
jgi:hypothetical protein